MIACPLCHQMNVKPHGWKVSDIIFQECKLCGFVFVPRPIPFSYKEIYNADYARLRGHDLISSPIYQSKLKTAQWYLKKMERFFTKGAMLDVGCSTGANVAKACDLGWEAFGVDINEAALNTARLNIPQAKFYQDLHHPEIIARKYALITLFDVIEHVEDIQGFIKNLVSLLDQKGVLFILTPDASSLSAHVMGNQWPHLFNEHISLFSKPNLATLLKNNNLRVVESGFAWKLVSFQGLYRHASCHLQKGIGGKIATSILSLFKNSSSVFPFNIGEFYMIAVKT